MQSVVDCVNEFYAGSFNYFFELYKANGWTIAEYGEHIKGIMKHCRENVNKIIKMKAL